MRDGEVSVTAAGAEAGAAADQSTAAVGGWHWVEWGCEFLGTALLLLGGLSGLFLNFSPSSAVPDAVPSEATRLLFTGLILGASGLAITFSPIGRRSGAHLNPAVSLAFWCRNHLHSHDLAGYLVAQFSGALVGTAAAWLLWGSSARQLDLGATAPGTGLSALGVAGTEAGMTCVLILGILLAVSSRGAARLTPLVAWGLVSILVWQGAEWTGASLNPARSLAPALLAPQTADLWAYLVGPLAGSLLAVAVYGTCFSLKTRTGKLLHDPRYPSTLASSLPSSPRR